MNGRQAKVARKITNDAKRQAMDEVAPAINATMGNEKKTRDRVEALEQWAQSFSGLSFVGRLRWLVLGAGR